MQLPTATSELTTRVCQVVGADGASGSLEHLLTPLVGEATTLTASQPISAINHVHVLVVTITVAVRRRWRRQWMQVDSSIDQWSYREQPGL